MVRRRLRIERQPGQSCEGAFSGEVAGFVVAAGGVAAMQMVVNDVVKGVDQRLHRRDQIGPVLRNPGKFFGEVVAA